MALKIEKKDSSLVIITTNYDLIVENLLQNNKYYYPEVPKKITGGNGKIPIYKLHGSINWLEKRWIENGGLMSMKGLGKERKADVSKNLLISEAELREWTYLFTGDEYEINGNRNNTYSPILIPFFFQKEYWLSDDEGWEKIFSPHWQSAGGCFEGGLTHIYFLGYGLPPADHHMLSWLLNILKKNKPRITIVCNGHNEPLERALRPFQPRVCQCGLERFLEDHLCLS